MKENPIHKEGLSLAIDLIRTQRETLQQQVDEGRLRPEFVEPTKFEIAELTGMLRFAEVVLGNNTIFHALHMAKAHYRSNSEK